MHLIRDPGKPQKCLFGSFFPFWEALQNFTKKSCNAFWQNCVYSCGPGVSLGSGRFGVGVGDKASYRIANRAFARMTGASWTADGWPLLYALPSLSLYMYLMLGL